ncbi:MAG: hypothetical protein IT191_02110 [Microbacteriaceae bacterium]|nr:hypothetical protein [Microbacteriaceae bacterium]
MGSISVSLSVILTFLMAITVTQTPIFPGFSIPLASADTLPLAVSGYLLTPIVTIIALFWDQFAQQRGLRNRNFVLRPKYGTWLRVLVLVSVLLGMWHILNIANAVAGAI